MTISPHERTPLRFHLRNGGTDEVLAEGVVFFGGRAVVSPYEDAGRASRSANLSIHDSLDAVADAWGDVVADLDVELLDDPSADSRGRTLADDTVDNMRDAGLSL